MAQRNIDFGTFPNDPDADAIRTAFTKTQQNFTELFSGLQDQAVLSVNQTPGQGITVSAPTGNVVVNADIACVRMTTSTLSLGLNGSNGTPDVTMINSTTQNLTIDLPANITGVTNASFSGTVTASAFVANTTIQATGNITGGNLLTSGNANVGNLTATRNITTTANIYANAGTIGASLLTGTLTTNAQPNITSVGTLTSLGVSGNLTVGTLGALPTSIPSVSGIIQSNYFVGNGSFLTDVTAAPGNLILNNNSNVSIPTLNSSVFVSVNGTANVLVISQTGINANGTANFTGNLSAANANLGNAASANFFIGNFYGTANSATNATTAGTVTTAAQPNITSVGTLTSLGVNGTVTAVAFTANTGVFTGNGSGLSAIAGANVTGTVASATAATTAGTVTTAAQPNITSVGTLSSLTVSGNASAGNLNTAGAVVASTLTSNVATGIAPLTVTSTTQVANLNAATAGTAGTVTTAAQPNITSVGTLTSLAVTGNLSSGNANLGNAATANFFIGSGNNLSNIQGANVTGAVASATSATTAGTVTTAAQPNITSVGTLTALGVNGNITAANITANTGVFTGNANGLTNIPGANVTGTVANATTATTAGTVTTNAQPNITSVGTLTSLAVTGNLSSGNANLGNLVTANFFSGDGSLLTNISVGAGSYIENGNSEVRVDANSNVRFTIAGNANVITVTGTGANIAGYANVTGNLSAGNVSATLLTGTIATASNAQPNITSLGTLTALNVNGVANLSAVGNVRISGGSNNQVLVATGTGSNVAFITATSLTTAPGSNTQVLFNDAGSFAANANMTFDKNTGTLTAQALSVTNSATFGNVFANSGTVRGNLLTGTLTTAAQPNVTSLGTLTLLIVSGNINAGNVSGGNLVTANFVAGTLTTAAQPNITSVGTLTGLGVNGNITAANITANTGIFSGNASGLTNIPAANVTGTVANATFATSAGSATTAGTVTTNAQPNITSVGTLSSLIVSGNAIAGNVYANSGTIGASLLAGTLTTASQPNITSVGTLTSLGVNGTVTAVAFTANTGIFTGNGAGLTNLNASNVSSGTLAQARLANSSLTVNGTSISLGGSGTITANTTQALTLGTFLTGTSFNGGTAVTAAVDATDAATASKVVSRDANASFAGNVITATTFSGSGANITTLNASNISSGTLAQARLANSSLTVNGTSIALGGSGTITATATNALTIGTGLGGTSYNGSTGVTITNTGVTSIVAGTNIAVSGATGAVTVSVTGTVPTATTAGTVTTAAQGNITSVGTLTGLTVSGNIIAQANVNMTGYVIRSVGTAISAAGSTQGTATAITKEMNVVSTVASGAGVVLPTAVAGMVISITNTSANTLLVYPATSAAINSGSVNAAYSQSAGSTLQFIAPTTTQWYTVGATFA